MTTTTRRERIIATLRDAGHGLTATELAEELGSTRPDIYHAANVLMSDGYLARRCERRVVESGTVHYLREVYVYVLKEAL